MMHCDTDMQWMLRWGQVYQPCGRTAARLPAGGYSCQLDHCGNQLFSRRELQTDELIDYPDSLPARIFREIEHFWGLRQRFAQFGFLHRRGYLLYGKQGGGKSSLIHQVVGHMISAGHVAFFCDTPHEFLQCMTMFRQVEPDRPMVCVFEDRSTAMRKCCNGWTAISR